MKILSWQAFNEILTSNSIDRIRPKKDVQLFLQHYESYFNNTAIGTGRGVNIEIRNQVNFSSIDIELKSNVTIPNEYPLPVVALYLVISGRVEVDFTSESISGGQWAVYSVPKGTYDFRIYGTQKKKKYHILGVHFTQESFRDFMGVNYEYLPSELIEHIQRQIPYAKIGSYPIELHDRILTIANSSFDQLHDKLRLEGLIYELMSYIVESIQLNQNRLAQSKAKSMEDICKLIVENPFHAPSKKELASHLKISESKFYKDFKSIYGVSPNEFIIDNKLMAARELLEQEDLSVNEVAYKAGYESVSSFSRLFYKRFGVRPGDVIKKDIS